MLFIVCLRFICRGSGATQCLSDAVPDLERKYIQNDHGHNIPIGLFECNWVTSDLMTVMVQIWVEEVLGYHTEISPQKGANAASPIWALAGCINFDDAKDKGEHGQLG